MPRSKGRTGRPWVRARTRCLTRAAAVGQSCYLCGRSIDYTLPYRDPVTGRVNVWSASAHHPIPLVHGGDPYDVVPAHLKCNRDAADRVVDRADAQLITSQDW